MLRFYWSLAKRTPGIIWESADKWDKLRGIAAACSAGVGVSFDWISWWLALIPFALVLIYGLMKINYNDFIEEQDKLKGERDEIAEERNKALAREEALKERLDYDRKRAAVNNLLGRAYRQGTFLDHSDTGKVAQWIDDTETLIEAALGEFYSAYFSAQHDIEGNAAEVKDIEDYIYELNWRDKLKRLDTIREQFSSLDIQPDFDPEEWKSSRDW